MNDANPIVVQVMQVKAFNKMMSEKPRPIEDGWHYMFVIPGRDKFRQRGWIAYYETDSVIEYARWYPNKKLAQEAKF